MTAGLVIGPPEPPQTSGPPSLSPSTILYGTLPLMSATILVIEDEPAIQELLRLNLTHAGYQVQLASDAAGAQAHIREALPDLVLLDWMLPDMSGIRLAKWLRTEERTHDIPLIMLTARGTEQDKVDGLEAGADDYVTKPFSPASCWRACVRCCAAARPSSRMTPSRWESCGWTRKRGASPARGKPLPWGPRSSACYTFS
ncbi:Phosphate regulon transcriptional regulatory protein PhoB OS=Castellaniella defragrans OX=75697 GN=HNR28_001456 PE=4 SV=1 [Castellaniella defragrans]